MRNKFLIILLVFFGLLFTGPANQVFAHTLAKDGKISAFLHISPDDKAHYGKINDISIYYNDQDFRFTTEGCDCRIKITQDKKILYSGLLVASGSRVGELKLLLPNNNTTYDVVVSGTPKTAGFFQPFNLNFDIALGTPPPVPAPSENKNLAVPISGGLMLAGSIGYFSKFSKKHRIKK